jgi:hypothetical protein
VLPASSQWWHCGAGDSEGNRLLISANHQSDPLSVVKTSYIHNINELAVRMSSDAMIVWLRHPWAAIASR